MDCALFKSFLRILFVFSHLWPAFLSQLCNNLLHPKPLSTKIRGNEFLIFFDNDFASLVHFVTRDHLPVLAPNFPKNSTDLEVLRLSKQFQAMPQFPYEFERNFYYIKGPGGNKIFIGLANVWLGCAPELCVHTGVDAVVAECKMDMHNQRNLAAHLKILRGKYYWDLTVHAKSQNEVKTFSLTNAKKIEQRWPGLATPVDAGFVSWSGNYFFFKNQQSYKYGLKLRDSLAFNEFPVPIDAVMSKNSKESGNAEEDFKIFFKGHQLQIINHGKRITRNISELSLQLPSRVDAAYFDNCEQRAYVFSDYFVFDFRIDFESLSVASPVNQRLIFDFLQCHDELYSRLGFGTKGQFIATQHPEIAMRMQQAMLMQQAMIAQARLMLLSKALKIGYVVFALIILFGFFLLMYTVIKKVYFKKDAEEQSPNENNNEESENEECSETEDPLTEKGRN